MIHRLSIIGGSLCNSISVPLTMRRSRDQDRYQTVDLPLNDICAECETMHTSHVAAGCEEFTCKPAIVSAEIQCPRCNRFHVDREEWYHKLHHCHRCEHCGHDFEFVPDPHHKYSRGIEPVSVRGRLTVLRHMFADWLYERLS